MGSLNAHISFNGIPFGNNNLRSGHTHSNIVIHITLFFYIFLNPQKIEATKSLMGVSVGSDW